MVLGVDQLAQQRAAAVPPQRREVVERLSGFGMLANPERAQRLWIRVVECVGGLQRPQLPVRQPVVHAARQYGSSSWAVTTGVMPSVTRWRRSSAASVRSTRISGR